MLLWHRLTSFSFKRQSVKQNNVYAYANPGDGIITTTTEKNNETSRANVTPFRVGQPFVCLLGEGIFISLLH